MTVRLVPAPVLDTIKSLDPERGIHIGGQGLAGATTFPVLDKATGEVIAEYADGRAADATAAVDAATAAFPGWASTAPRARSEVLRRAFELMLARREELAGLISAENGKALDDARSEVTYAAEFFRWFAEEAVRSDGDFAQSPAGGTRTVVTSRPVGVAALVTPWNFPAAMATRKIGPALAAGCTVVLKPAAETPLTALAIARILEEAGTPVGAVNVVATTDPGTIVGTWLADARVRKLSFTGSTGVGRLLLGQAADRIVNTTMELGGNAPFVIAADADLDAAVAGAMVAKFRNGGQACTAANRFYVHADVFDAFVAKFGAAIANLKVGSAFEDGTTIGPLINAKTMAGLSALVDDALTRGARISHQATTSRLPGHFFPPTLLIDVAADSDVIRNEIFGPIAPVVSWSDENELLAQVNDTDLGLAAYIFSSDLQWALRLAERTDAGMVGINRGTISDPAAPFGGLKHSGLGREGAHEGLHAFTETQYFSIAWPT